MGSGRAVFLIIGPLAYGGTDFLAKELGEERSRYPERFLCPLTWFFSWHRPEAFSEVTEKHNNDRNR
jgi:hypothetical protein